MKTLGIVLIIAGILMMIYVGYHYVVPEKTMDLGSVKIIKEKEHYVYWSPIAGILLFLGGIFIIAFNNKIAAK